ncbi:MAG: hypothetical protein IT452_23325 [Planctomycetia bacterium]|nr:hypothetical protein [Planctomycetia bacterium]
MARDRQEEIATGARLRTSYLLEQADYTAKLAKSESALLSPLGINKAFMDAFAALRSKIDAASKDRTIASADSQAATMSQNEAFQKAKEWLSAAVLLGQAAYDGDHALSDEFGKGPKIGRSVPKLCDRLKAVLALLRRDKARVAAFGVTDALLKSGDDLYAALTDADCTQEHKKTTIPQATEDFYVDKAQLYFRLKQINRIGKAAHVRDPLKAANYNLTILHRHGVKTGEKGEAVGAGAGEKAGG